MAVRFVTWTTSISRENSREGATTSADDAGAASSAVGAATEAVVAGVEEVAAAGPSLQLDALSTRVYRITAGASSVRQSLRTSSGP